MNDYCYKGGGTRKRCEACVSEGDPLCVTVFVFRNLAILLVYEKVQIKTKTFYSVSKYYLPREYS